MGIFIHLANILLLVSFCLKDILWLRALNIVASGCFLLYFSSRPIPMMAPIGWNLLLTSINIYQIWLLWLERRPVFLTEEEHRLHQQVFPMLTPQQFLKLMTRAERKQAPADTTLIQRGVEVPEILLITEGRVTVVLGPTHQLDLHDGQFVGEMSFLTNSPACAEVITQENTHYLAWPQQPLRSFFAQQPDLYTAMQQAMGHDLIHKLRQA